MKKTFLSVLVLFAAICCFGQQNNEVQPQVKDSIMLEPEARTSLNVGLLMGGGGLLGADFEFLVSKRVGLQLGGGIGSMSFGVNYHLKPCINSSFVSVQYWRQGFGDNYYASYLGPMFVFRAKKIFQIGIGLGTILSTGPGWDRAWENKTEPTSSVALLYNIGVFFPL